MALSIYVNTSSNDVARASAPGDFTLMDLTNDKLIFSAGSASVADGQPIPNTNQLTSAGVLITISDVEVAHFFLADFNVNLLKEIHNAGKHNKRYVFCFAFSAATASEPVLEMWDDTDMDSYADYCLGQSVSTNSFFRGITTTSGAPGLDDWSGNRLAGSDTNHFLFLNDENSALTVATDLYCNLRVTVPSSFGNAASESPIVVCKYTTN